MSDLFDFRVPRDDVEGLDEDEYLWALMEPAWDDPSDTTAGQQLLVRVTYFCRTVQNGGVITAFHNFGPQEIREIQEGFRLLGAREFDQALKDAEQILFPRGVPKTLEAQRAFVQSLDRDAFTERVEPHSAILENEPALQKYLRKYVDAHPKEFFKD